MAPGPCFGRDLRDRSTGVSSSIQPHVLREYALIVRLSEAARADLPV